MKDKIEKLARAMCEGAGLNPDETYSHGPDMPPGASAVHDILLQSPNWTRFAREAEIWIFKNGNYSLKDSEPGEAA